MRLSRPSPAFLMTGIFLILGLVWGGFLGFRHIAGVGSVIDGFEDLTLDWRYAIAGPRPAPRGIVIVAVDDETVRQVGAYPLPRTELARILRAVAAFDPQAVAIDIAFLDAGPPEADAELAAALGATKSVVAAIGLFGRDDANDEPRQSADLALVPALSRVLWPTAEIRAAATAGLVNVATDAAGIPRFIPMLYRNGDRMIPSFALATAAAAFNAEPAFGPDRLRLGARRIDMDLGYHLPIRYYGAAGAIRQVSAARVLRHEFSAEDVRGQVVLIGATAVGVGDMFATPFDRTVPGVEIFATAIANLMAGDGLIRTPIVRGIDATAALLLPCATILLMAMRRAVAGLALAGLVFASWGGLAFAAFLEGYWLSLAVPLTALVPVTVGYGAARLALDRYATGRLTADKATLTRFQSPVLLAHILETPGFLQRPVHQDVAVIFLDLSGFTGVAEALGPLQSRDLLVEFQAIIERDVAMDKGFVVSFMGDGAMILFGLPEARPDDAARAFRSAGRLHTSALGWLTGLPPEAGSQLSIRIGGHFGPVVVSRLGPAHHQHITATGDTVNVASRLLEVGKQRQCSLVVSADLFAAADLPESSHNKIAGVSVDVNIRGRAQSLRILTWR
jgi:adenylate cyclase